ncbi:Mss4-like protein [Glarea lozoyensis ATCC 20868]|uniref:Mss4-like protein n=1 Tax=Glarea lozoyensis (strain ATCC 20868 / MF5171) TaxID=1116229 RepID=S3EAE7_GLAL2|nr:Mss4-like protein [Glarea lozoyensis ATCC 20868]EPE35273.1 Mss4-like protein [Glarea lozoyensis ATCC 20868]
MPGSGSCLCGAITYEFTGAPATTAICHCTDCQKWAGSALSTNVAVPHDSFKVTKGEAKRYEMRGASGLEYPHFFCADCGSSIYAQPQLMPELTLIRAGTLDNGGAEFDVEVEFYTKDRKGFVSAVEGAKQCETMS